MLVLMADTERRLAQRVRGMVEGASGALRLVQADAFRRAAASRENAGANVLALPFDNVTAFTVRTLQWLWSWEGTAVPFIVSSANSAGTRLLARVAPASVPFRFEAFEGAMDSAQALRWLPVQSLSLQALISVGHCQREAAPPRPRSVPISFPSHSITPVHP